MGAICANIMINKPCVLYILHNPFIRCGTELHTRALFDGLSDKYDTWVVYRKDDSLFLSNDAQTTSKFPADPMDKRVAPLNGTLTEESLRAVFSRVQPELIHIQHFYNWPLNVINWTLELNKPVVLSLHDYYAITPAFTMTGVSDPRVTLTADYSKATFGEDITGYLKLRREILSQSLERVTQIVVPSEFLARRMKAIFPVDYRVIPHGIHGYLPMPKRMPDDKVIFGFVGHLNPSKGWESLVAAFRLLRDKCQHTELHLFGSPRPERDDMPGIIYHGRYAQEDLPRIFSRIDVAVIPSVFAETFCLVLSEAWMAGVPVAASDIGALGDRVVDGVNGKKFQPGNVESVRHTLAWFLKNDEWKTWNIKKPRTTRQMCLDYDLLYAQLLKHTDTGSGLA